MINIKFKKNIARPVFFKNIIHITGKLSIKFESDNAIQRNTAHNKSKESLKHT